MRTNYGAEIYGRVLRILISQKDIKKRIEDAYWEMHLPKRFTKENFPNDELYDRHMKLMKKMEGKIDKMTADIAEKFGLDILSIYESILVRLKRV
jgi:hypothetical protein